MRGLTKATPSRTAWITGGAVAALAAAGGLALVGCGAGSEGLRKEGRADTTEVGEATPGAYSGSAKDDTPSASPGESAPPAEVDAVRLVKDDPKVNADLKANLKPCTTDGKEYPVDVAYGALTGKKATDVVVTVMTCADGIGIGSYVYRKRGDAYENVFVDERAPLFAGIDKKGRLTVTQLVSSSSDAAWPAGEDTIVFEWSPSKEQFTESSRIRTDYGEGTEPEPAETDDGSEDNRADGVSVPEPVPLPAPSSVPAPASGTKTVAGTGAETVADGGTAVEVPAVTPRPPAGTTEKG
ncbi:hypothetical protein IHE55_13050 [Streptomyces pactum]|uniref:Lipoprotein CseA n=1 Tax=Streptomyces pactum TaxID=68249 RepID=A0ABS0NKN5_9ACTN|nr:hypothetical protein [Streptomyces pactum]MBH5335672.1 hypothetical protein [Streptomyces pactum]